MKTFALACLGTLVSALGSFAQESQVLVDNGEATVAPGEGISDLTAANYYAGPYGVQVWELCPPPQGAGLATLLAGINNAPSGLAGYQAMVADGFKLEHEFDGNNNSPQGYYIGVGVVSLPDVSPQGANVILGLAFWNTSTSFATMLTTPGAHLGVIAFPQNTDTLVGLVPLVPDICAGWLSLNGGTGQELVMTPIPEPGSLALIGLGVGALLAFRSRRKRKAGARPRRT